MSISAIDREQTTINCRCWSVIAYTWFGFRQYLSLLSLIVRFDLKSTLKTIPLKWEKKFTLRDVARMIEFESMLTIHCPLLFILLAKSIMVAFCSSFPIIFTFFKKVRDLKKLFRKYNQIYLTHDEWAKIRDDYWAQQPMYYHRHAA